MMTASTQSSAPAERSSRVRFVLVAPSHPGNIGAAARAIKTMGFDRLDVVLPRFADFTTHPDAVAFSAHAADVLAQASVFDRLDQALTGVSRAYAMTGYARELGPAMIDLRAAAIEARVHLERDAGAVAFVFGSERNGLLNADVQRCQAACAITADPRSASLNLAQAVQVTAYECRYAGLSNADAVRAADASDRADRIVAPPAAADPFDAPAAGVDAIEAMYAHLEQALIAVDFLDPAAPRRLMPRLRRLFNRAGLSITDVDVLRGIWSAIIMPKPLRGPRGQPTGPGAAIAPRPTDAPELPPSDPSRQPRANAAE